MKKIIVAYDQKHGIGAKNDLLWMRDLPADLQHFKNLTTGSAIIMGRKTYESIGRALPNRQNIVVSRSAFKGEGATVVDSLEAAYQAANSKDVWIIGGGQIYELALETVDEIYATEVSETFAAADVFFPVLDKKQWQEISREHHAADERNKYDFDFVIYSRQRLVP